jgi:hypothetical protein
MSVFTNINAALNTKLNTLASPPTFIWPNTKAQPVNGTSYITPHLMPATTTLNNLDGTQLHKGIYQIDVYVPLQSGLSVLTGYLDSLLTLFKGQSLTANGDIVHVQAVGISATERQDGWYRSFVEVNYICYS